MKSKLTITVENNLIPQSKLAAHLKGMSLSQLIEHSLQDIVAASHLSGNVSGLSFSNRWKERFIISNRTDVRTRLLKKRFQL